MARSFHASLFSVPVVYNSFSRGFALLAAKGSWKHRFRILVEKRNMASVTREGNRIYEEDEEEDEITEEEDEDEEDLNSASPSTSGSSEHNKNSIETPSSKIASITVEPQQIQVSKTTITDKVGEKSKEIALLAQPVPIDESRKLFQRLWTDEDEIGLLQGFLEYSLQKGGTSAAHGAYHHENQPFYDQIKSKLQLDFNKNQLVEKLRRLKKKYRNIVSKMNSGKDFSFKSAHDQATFEISRKIWSSVDAVVVAGGGVEEVTGFDEDEAVNQHYQYNDSNNSLENHKILTPDKTSKSRKRKKSVPTATPEFNNVPDRSDQPPPSSTSIPNIEETVKGCLSPFFKELIHCAINGSSNSGYGFMGGMGLNPFSIKFSNLEMAKLDEKWRKQYILELEVYSKRMELMQEQIKSTLDDLRSLGN